jgi:hypothetical protein
LLVAAAIALPGSQLSPSVVVRGPFATGGNFTSSMSLHDVNGDGRPDVITTIWSKWSKNESEGQFSVMLTHPDGTLSMAHRYAAGGLPRKVAVGDFTNDGLQDIAVTDAGEHAANLLLFFGTGDGTFRFTPYYIGVATFDIVAGDFNRDGVTDLALTGPAGVLVLLGRGDGTFVFTREDPIPAHDSLGLTAADMNADGAVDLVVSNESWGIPGSVFLLVNDGTGSFHATRAFATGTSVGNTATGINPLELAVADVNGDGQLDVVTNNSDSDDLSLLYGDGVGGLSNAKVFGFRHGGGGLVLADVNGDGRPDVVTSGDILLNAKGFFGRPISFGAAVGSDLAFADVDGDGTQDLAVESPDESSLWFLLRRAPARPVSVPRLVGRSLAVATALLARAGAVADPIHTVRRAGRRGVIGQFPASGTSILRGAPVRLVVNAGRRR